MAKPAIHPQNPRFVSDLNQTPSFLIPGYFPLYCSQANHKVPPEMETNEMVSQRALVSGGESNLVHTDWKLTLNVANNKIASPSIPTMDAIF